MSADSGSVPPGGLAHSISREALAELPIRRYEGEVCRVATQHDLDRAWADIRDERVVGFDTETRPAFTKGERHLPCLAQVATARAVYLFQFRGLDVFPCLAAMLADARIAKAGVALAEDLRTLQEVFPFTAHNLVDLGVIARGWGLKQSGVRNLAGIILGFRIPKGARTSNWAAPRLTQHQVTYAATDAWACRELYLRFEHLGLLRAPQSARAG